MAFDALYAIETFNSVCSFRIIEINGNTKEFKKIALKRDEN